MMIDELKHTAGGKFKVKWQWGMPPASQPQEPKWFRWLYFETMEDANDFVERYVKTWFPEERYEIEEV